MKKDRKLHNLKIFLIVFISTLIFYRLLIPLIGETSVYLFGSEIHHFYFGVILIIFTGFIRFFSTKEKFNKIDLILFGIGTGMVMDEFIYIIFTAGDHLSYFSNISFYGMMLSSVILIIIFYLTFRGINYEEK